MIGRRSGRDVRRAFHDRDPMVERATLLFAGIAHLLEDRGGAGGASHLEREARVVKLVLADGKAEDDLGTVEEVRTPALQDLEHPLVSDGDGFGDVEKTVIARRQLDLLGKQLADESATRGGEKIGWHVRLGSCGQYNIKYYYSSS